MSILLAACGGSAEDAVPAVTEAAEATAKTDVAAKPERETVRNNEQKPVVYYILTLKKNTREE